ncbi:alpha-2-macroglobulin-like protein 1 [Rhinoderma darwinii]|uniref:alpha-2-macroglobulin-like protein 1 n=1 Tax=Rhinoderma darwinii TaxID=43563 RepID=UPI003F662098
MWLLLVPVCLAIFSSSHTSASEPHYVITVPANLEQGTEEKACVTFLDLKGAVDIKIELKNDDQVYNLAEHKVNTHDHSECYTFQVPIIKDDRSVWLLHVSIHGENINVDETKKVVIVKREDLCFIQNDKSTYKPGDIVKFRLISVNKDFQAINKQYPLVEIKDPDKNRIAQWLDVSTNQGFADFNFHLANELALGEYKINIPNGCEKYFKVDEYVLKRFELNINFPSNVVLTDKSFHLDACGSYTYGKPVEGSIDLSVCAETYYTGWRWNYYSSEEENTERKCIVVKGEKTDSKGCVSREIQLGYFNFSTTERNQFLEINSELTEDGTGHSEKSSAGVYLSHAKKIIQFVGCEPIYHKGFPYHGKIKVSDDKKQPLANEAVFINLIDSEDFSHSTHEKLMTDSNGIAHFTLNTSKWETHSVVKARLPSGDDDDDDDDVRPSDYFQQENNEEWLWLAPFYSKSESLLTIQRRTQDVSCNSEQSVTVEYDIHKKTFDSDTDHLHFFYILLSKSGISSYKDHKVDFKDQGNNPNLHGSFLLDFHVDPDFFPVFSLLVFSVLPNGETIAGAGDYNVSPCTTNTVKLSFSEQKVRPGENVNLEVTADAGSLCSVRSVDKGYLLEKPHDDRLPVAAEVTEGWIPSFHGDLYTHLIVDPETHQCPENTTAQTEHSYDVYKMFLAKNLQIFTNTQIKVPMTCVPNDFTHRSATNIRNKKTDHKGADKEIQKHFTRSYFPDIWLYELVPVGSEGHTVLNRTTPHTITKWVTDAFCLGKSGFATVKDVELTAFQPYFIDLIVPHSVVQGEKFTIQAIVFSYVKKCILIVVSLSDSEDLITAKNKEQARCVCEGHSHSFSWDAAAVKPKTLKIHADSGSLEVDGDCTSDPLLIGEDRRLDSVEKIILVKPKGLEDEKTETFLLYPSDNREAIAININSPKGLVPGSERAHVIILGDLFANIAINLDNILYMPDGCGEQNIAKFFRYVCTMEYLESVKELTPDKKAKILEALVEGYQKQLTFRSENGSYVLFPGASENLWLTAFVVKAFNGAQKFIYINENHIQQAVNWLHSKQLPDGCFRDVGYYFNNEVEADNLVTRTAYIAIALLEHHVVYNGSIVENALSCLRKSADNVTSAHSQALLAYAFTLSGDTELREQILKKLDESAVKKGSKHWESNSYLEGEIETASYVVLALLSEKTKTSKNLEDSVDIIRWILTQQNAWGGFHSSQDTTIALQALAKYGKATNHNKGDSTVTISSKSGFQKIVHVDQSNGLLVQTVDLPEIPGEYTASATGDGFVYIQSHTHYNAIVEQPEKEHFSFNVSTEPSVCTHASQKKFDVHVDVRYSGTRENTNMAVIILETVSGYIPDKDSVKKLKKNPLVEKTEISVQNISIYLSKLNHETVSFVFSLEQDAHVENLQPAHAAVFDYYDPDEHTVVEYNAPCSSLVAHCTVTAAERTDCGHPNISKDECEHKGCCFDSSISGTKWCFHQGFKKIENH